MPFEIEIEDEFITKEIDELLLRAAVIKLGGRVDGAIRLVDTERELIALIFEVKESQDGISAATAKEADEQIRHRANLVDLNPCTEPLILLSVIGCSIRPYLWMNGTIRPSNSDLLIHESRVSPGPSPSLWVDLRTEAGKRLFQHVVVDVTRVAAGESRDQTARQYRSKSSIGFIRRVGTSPCGNVRDGRDRPFPSSGSRFVGE